MKLVKIYNNCPHFVAVFKERAQFPGYLPNSREVSHNVFLFFKYAATASFYYDGLQLWNDICRLIKNFL